MNTRRSVFPHPSLLRSPLVADFVLLLSRQNAITALQLHPAPQAHLITTSSVDATLKTWDVRNGSLIGTHEGHRDVVNAFAVGGGGDGKSAIVSGGDDGLNLVWVV